VAYPIGHRLDEGEYAGASIAEIMAESHTAGWKTAVKV
jgi:hypothetical protein